MSLAHIKPRCGVNLGGLQALRVYPVENVLQLDEPVGSIVREPMQLSDYFNYTDIFFREGSFEELETQDELGAYYKAKVKLFIPRDAPGLLEGISLLRGKKAVCVYTDHNGYSKVVGTPDFPLRFSSALSTGSKVRDKNGYELSFYGSLPARASFYLTQESAPIDQGLPPGVYLATKDGTPISASPKRLIYIKTA